MGASDGKKLLVLLVRQRVVKCIVVFSPDLITQQMHLYSLMRLACWFQVHANHTFSPYIVFSLSLCCNGIYTVCIM